MKTSDKINLYIHKYGIVYNFTMFIILIHAAGMRPNTGIYWGFWLNLIMSFYFIFVKGLTEGIKNTIMISSIIEKEKEKNDKDISNN